MTFKIWKRHNSRPRAARDVIMQPSDIVKLEIALLTKIEASIEELIKNKDWTGSEKLKPKQEVETQTTCLGNNGWTRLKKIEPRPEGAPWTEKKKPARGPNAIWIIHAKYTKRIWWTSLSSHVHSSVRLWKRSVLRRPESRSSCQTFN